MNRAIINCRMVDVETGDIQRDTSILWANGTIQAVGKNIHLPPDTEVIDANGKFVTPGLINGFTHLGLKETGIRWEGNDSNEQSATIHPDLRVIDGIYPFDKEFTQAIKTGVTTVHVSPGPENVISGISATIKTTGTDIDSMILKEYNGLVVSFGENPKKANSAKKRAPYTRMKIASIIRETFNNELYNKQGNGNEESIVSKILQRKATMFVQAHRLDDIMTAVRLKKEFNIHVVIVHGTEAYKAPDIIKESNIPVMVGPLLASKMRYEMKGLQPDLAVSLHTKNIPLALVTPIVRNLPFEGAIAIREGLTWKDALYGMTQGTAKILGVSNSVGTIEKGKDADFVIWDGEPLELLSTVEETIIGGTTVYKKGGYEDEIN